MWFAKPWCANSILTRRKYHEDVYKKETRFLKIQNIVFHAQLKPVISQLKVQKVRKTKSYTFKATTLKPILFESLQKQCNSNTDSMSIQKRFDQEWWRW